MSVSEGRTNPWLWTLVGSQVVLAAALAAIVLINGVIIPPLIAFSVLCAGMAGALVRWSRRRWLTGLAAALSGLILISSVPFFVEDLAHPETFSTFFPAGIASVAALVGVAAGIAGAAKRAPVMPRLVSIAAATVVAILFGISLAATLNLEGDARAEGDLIIVGEGYEFRPGTVTVPSGRVGIYIENEDLVRHTFVIEGRNVKQELPGSTSRRLEIDLPAGEYRFYCDVPGHEKMDGTLTVS